MTPEQVKNARKYAQVIFEDNTYKSNRYGEALALFCGINEHGQTLLLAQGCMPSSENAEDYEWLWQEWIKGTGCAPRVLFSDAAYALLGSVPRVFPPDRTAHFLCLFHIYKNLPKTAETPSSNTISLLLRAPSDRFRSAQIRTLLIFSGAKFWRTPAGKLSRTTLESDPPYIVLTVGVLHGR